MKKGKFIVIEGIDSSGKGTQLKLLSDRVKKAGKKVLTADFPRYYDSAWGKMVGEFLTGKFGKFESISPYFAALPYMIDQYTWSRDVGKKWLNKGGLIILDRFFTSNTHQVAKLISSKKKAFRQWIWPMGYEELGILKPDFVLFLDVPPTITKQLLKTKSERKYLHGKKKDQAEKNWTHQWAAYKEYKYMTTTDKSWVSINCVNKGKLDSPEFINERIWKVVSKVI